MSKHIDTNAIKAARTDAQINENNTRKTSVRYVVINLDEMTKEPENTRLIPYTRSDSKAADYLMTELKLDKSRHVVRVLELTNEKAERRVYDAADLWANRLDGKAYTSAELADADATADGIATRTFAVDLFSYYGTALMRTESDGIAWYYAAKVTTIWLAGERKAGAAQARMRCEMVTGTDVYVPKSDYGTIIPYSSSVPEKTGYPVAWADFGRNHIRQYVRVPLDVIESLHYTVYHSEA